MDPATMAALIQLITLGINTFEQYSNGTITAAQANELLSQASNNLQNAITAFNATQPKSA